MNSGGSRAGFLASLVMLVMTSGCFGKLVKWDPILPASTVSGAVQIKEITDKRMARDLFKFGAGPGTTSMGQGQPISEWPSHWREVGNNSYEGTIPEKEASLDQTLIQFLKETLAGAGFNVVQGDTPPKVLVTMDVETFWCTYSESSWGVSNVAAMKAKINVLDPDGSVRGGFLLNEEVKSNVSCYTSWKEMMNRAAVSAMGGFRKSEIRAALLGEAPVSSAVATTVATPAAAPAAAPTAAACVSGQTITEDTLGHCCWPGQNWLPSRKACVGAPQWCPPGLVSQTDQCVPKH